MKKKNTEYQTTSYTHYIIISDEVNSSDNITVVYYCLLARSTYVPSCNAENRPPIRSNRICVIFHPSVLRLTKFKYI